MTDPLALTQQLGALFNADCHWNGAGNYTFTQSERETFLRHITELIGEVRTDRLTTILLATRGRYASVQDEAQAIVKRLG